MYAEPTAVPAAVQDDSDEERPEETAPAVGILTNIVLIILCLIHVHFSFCSKLSVVQSSCFDRFANVTAIQ